MDTIDSRATASHRRQTGQLRRLETLTDVVYGLAIWRVFMLLPRPDEPEWSWHSWREFFAVEGMTVVLIAIGVAVLIIYWLQSNTLLSLVESTAALLLGLSSSWMWSYAAKDRRLLHRDVTDDEARAIRTRITAEPATALFTVPFVFTPIFWELAWFTYPAVRRLFSRRGRRTFPTQR